MNASRRSSSNWVTVAFAIFAAFVGMSSCYVAAGTVQGTGGLFGPFFTGGIVTALIFRVLIGTSLAGPDDDRGGAAARARRGRREGRADTERPKDPRQDAIIVFLSLTAVFTIVSTLMAGVVAVGGIGHPAGTRRQVLDLWLSGAWKGALVGLVVSLPLSASASGLMWIVRRRR